MRILVVGGASSGKSVFAEETVVNLASRSDEPFGRVYLATMQAFGEEGARRIKRHRRLREGKGFVTLERCCDLAALDVVAFARAGGIPVVDGVLQAVVLVEDLGNLLANEMFSDAGTFERGDGPLLRADAGVRHLERSFTHVVAVSNDVGRDGRRFEDETQAYIAQAGALNCKLAARFDVVIEVVCGMPQVVKGELSVREAFLPESNRRVLSQEEKGVRR